MAESFVKDRLHGAMGELTPSERRVGHALLAAYPIAGLETMVELAARAHVSVATVLRFVTKLGFDGFPAFQRQLRDEMQERFASPLTLYGSRDAPADVGDVLAQAERVFGDALATTFADLPRAEFDAAVGLLADERRRIGCTGGRLSGVLAYYLGAHLQALRPNTFVLGGGAMPRSDWLVDIDRRCVLMVFDYRRYQTDTIELASRAKKRGATIVLVTDPWLSPIAAVADHVLPTSVEAPSPFDSLVAGMALVEALVAALSSRLSERAQRRMELLDDLREGFVLSAPVPWRPGREPPSNQQG